MAARHNKSRVKKTPPYLRKGMIIRYFLFYIWIAFAFLITITILNYWFSSTAFSLNVDSTWIGLAWALLGVSWFVLALIAWRMFYWHVYVSPYRLLKGDDNRIKVNFMKIALSRTKMRLAAGEISPQEYREIISILKKEKG